MSGREAGTTGAFPVGPIPQAARLTKAEPSSSPEIRRFVDGIRSHEAIAHAAVSGLWGNRPLDGHVNRLKTIKREMYGRARFVLLRARVVNVA